MGRVLLGRAAQALLVMAGMSVVIHGLLSLMPGDPVDLMASGDPRLTPDDIARLRALWGLDQPWSTRYWHWVSGVLRGEFGYSRLFHQPVMDLLPGRLGLSLLLMGSSLILALSLAIPAGVVAACHPGSRGDALLRLACLAGISLPSFWVALLLILVFAVGLGWLPAGGAGPPGGDAGLWARLPYLPLPVATLVLAFIGSHARYVRAAMGEALLLDAVRTARAKGLSETRVVWGHALPNALGPLITLVGLEFGGLFSGALITETVFAWPGVGRLIYDAIMGSDFNTALVALLLVTAMTQLGSLLADLAHAALDPRISFSGRR